jgi:SAM-dependent methyltransferase
MPERKTGPRRTTQALRAQLGWDAFPLTAKYDPAWILENEMGPNALWLAESLLAVVDLKPGMRVLDMGCGRGLTSVFYARERGVQVFAADLWVPPTENYARFREAGVDDRVFPFQVEARALPFAQGYFDAILSVDAFHYFGTDDLYLKYFAPFVKEGGPIGIVVPGLAREFDGPIPEHLTRRQKNGAIFWDMTECVSFHTAEWWERHWAATGLVDVRRSELLPNGWELWRRWEETRDGGGHTQFPSDAEALREDGGRYIGFVRVVARRK